MVLICLQSNSKPSESAHFCSAGKSSRMLTRSETPSYRTNFVWEHEYFFLTWFCSSFSNQIRILFFVSCLPTLCSVCWAFPVMKRGSVKCACPLSCCAGKNRSSLSMNSLPFCRYRRPVSEQQMTLCLSVAFIFTAFYHFCLGTTLF